MPEMPPMLARYRACFGMNPDLFAPEGVDTVAVVALLTCRDCPVRELCHDYAHADGELAQWTIHGGELPHRYSFRDARLVECAWCARPKVIGGRASHDGPAFCNNRCRYAYAADQRRRAAGEATLFDREAVPA